MQYYYSTIQYSMILLLFIVVYIHSVLMMTLCDHCLFFILFIDWPFIDDTNLFIEMTIFFYCPDIQYSILVVIQMCYSSVFIYCILIHLTFLMTYS